MSDMPLIFLAGIITFFVGATVGYGSAESSISKDCDVVGKFRVNEQAYQCSKAEKEPK